MILCLCPSGVVCCARGGRHMFPPEQCLTPSGAPTQLISGLLLGVEAGLLGSLRAAPARQLYRCVAADSENSARSRPDGGILGRSFVETTPATA